MPYIPDETVPQPGQYAPLALAFVGDGVYELYVRTRLMRAGSLQANKLHRLATQYVKAGAQAVSVRAILDKLSEEESAVYRRAGTRNPPPCPKMPTWRSTGCRPGSRRFWAICT